MCFNNAWFIYRTEVLCDGWDFFSPSAFSHEAHTPFLVFCLCQTFSIKNKRWSSLTRRNQFESQHQERYVLFACLSALSPFNLDQHMHLKEKKCKLNGLHQRIAIFFCKGNLCTGRHSCLTKITIKGSYAFVLGGGKTTTDSSAV